MAEVLGTHVVSAAAQGPRLLDQLRARALSAGWHVWWQATCCDTPIASSGYAGVCHAFADPAREL